MLSFYVHTHWGYNNPYAARTWTLEDWLYYLDGLSALGYDAVMIWPLLDSMPLRLTSSDRTFLARIGRAIDLAHEQFGMKTIICCNSNVIGNAAAETYEYETRPYFTSEAKLNPGDRADMATLQQHLRQAFEYLHRTDMISVIDSDPGGYVGSSNDEFVELMRMKIETVRESNPQAELYYWMHVGWENYNRFWEEALTWEDPYTQPPIHWDLEVFVETLELMIERMPEPWGLFVNHLHHFEATERLGLHDKRLQLPYGVVEGEPTFPLTNWNPMLMDRAINHAYPNYVPEMFPRGRMGNAQTHCLQLPHTYLFAHMAKGGSVETADLEAFAGDLLPDCAYLVARSWSVLETEQPEAQRVLATKLRDEARGEQRTGRCRGLLFGDPARFLVDLAMNLEVRARLAELRSAIDDGTGVRAAIRDFLDDFGPYQKRLGFVDAYGGPLYTGLNAQVLRLEDPDIDRACNDFTNWANPSLRNGALARLLGVLAAYARQE